MHVIKLLSESKFCVSLSNTDHVVQYGCGDEDEQQQHDVEQEHDVDH